MDTIADGTERIISVGQLRQNPTAMIHDVVDGKEYVLTDRGRRVAKIVPYTEPNWVKVEDAVGILNTSTDPVWLQELAQDRVDSDMKDPWAG